MVKRNYKRTYKESTRYYRGLGFTACTVYFETHYYRTYKSSDIVKGW